jgi:predicted ribosomally synthesized peptide with nif11-like leader
MLQISPSQFLADAKQDEDLKKQLRSALTLQGCIEVAESYGYEFSGEELQAEFDKMPDDVLGELVNPGVTPRRHIKPH